MFKYMENDFVIFNLFNRLFNRKKKNTSWSDKNSKNKFEFSIKSTMISSIFENVDFFKSFFFEVRNQM